MAPEGSSNGTGEKLDGRSGPKSEGIVLVKSESDFSLGSPDPCPGGASRLTAFCAVYT